MGEILLTCCFEVMMLNCFLKTLLGNRKRYKGFYVPIMMFFVVGILALVNSFHNTLANLFSVPVIYCIYTIISYSESILKCISSAVCFYMLAMVPEFVISTIFSLSNYHDAEKVLENELSRLCLLLPAKMITFIIVKCVEQIYKKKEYDEVRNGIFCYLLVLPVATMVLLVGLFYADIHIPEKNKLFLEIGVIMLLFVNIFMFYIFDKLITTMAKANKMERLYVKSAAENKYYQQMEHVHNKYKTLLHDIKKYIRTAADLIQAKDTNHALQIFEKLDIKIKSTSYVNYCSNKILNAILHERQIKADELGIKYHINLSQDLYVDHIDDMDLISIVGNLIDNAIEASSKLSEDGFVKIKMFMANEGHFMVWEMRNNFLTSPVLGRKGFITSKYSKDEHGIGIHIVEKIVQSYGGKLKIDIDDLEFNASIIFPIDRSDRQ